MIKLTESDIKHRIDWVDEEHYASFDFDAHNDKNKNKYNLELVMRFKEFLPVNNKYYILPCSRKGFIELLKYNSIESFVNDPLCGGDSLEEMAGRETWEILNVIVSLSNFIDASEKSSRAVEKPITRNISKNVRYKVLQEQKWKCNNCHTKLKFDEHSDWEGREAHIDHIHPFADRKMYPGGEYLINERSNLQGLCSVCNQKKLKNKN